MPKNLEKITDESLRERLAGVFKKIKEYGSKSEELRDYVNNEYQTFLQQDKKAAEEFLELAAVSIYLATKAGF